MKKMTPFWILVPTALLLALSACAPQAPLRASAADASPNPLAGTSWKLIFYGPVSEPKGALADVETNLTFGANGQLSGTLGCNSMGGGYTVTDQTITFGSIFMTEMACDEPRMAQESAAFDVLKDTATFIVEGETLTITSTDGNNMMSFISIPGQ